MTSLYVLANDYRDAALQMADMDLPANVIADTLEGLAGELEVKATNVAMFIRNLESTAASIKEAEAEMAKRRKALEARADFLHRYLLDNMQRTGIQKIECPYFKLSVRDNPQSVVIDSPDLIPADFMRQPEPPPPAPDKKAIAEALKAGQDVPGAHLERTQRLEIK